MMTKIKQWFAAKPQNLSELQILLRDAASRHVITFGALSMTESVLQLSAMQVRDVMIPRSQLVAIDIDDGWEKVLPVIVESGHSRFPVIDENMDEVEGILLAKDVLSRRFSADEEPLSVKELLRPAMFVPESKRLDVLLREFRATHTHMAVVVNEYGRTSGVVTIEDVLEQIVGDIEDEHDLDEEDFVKSLNENCYTIKAHWPIEEFNEYFKSHYEEPHVDTVGGLVLSRFGYLPKRGETITIDQFYFKILLSDNRRIRLLEMRQH